MNIAILFGLLWNNVIRVADAARAFLQADLLAKHDTFVSLPFEMWLPEWKGTFRIPIVRLDRALYGHPHAAALWDVHLMASRSSLRLMDIPRSIFMKLGISL